jgi:hypothetical protein
MLCSGVSLISPNVFQYITEPQILDCITKATDPHKRHENIVDDVKEKHSNY